MYELLVPIKVLNGKSVSAIYRNVLIVNSDKIGFFFLLNGPSEALMIF